MLSFSLYSFKRIIVGLVVIYALVVAVSNLRKYGKLRQQSERRRNVVEERNFKPISIEPETPPL